MGQKKRILLWRKLNILLEQFTYEVQGSQSGKNERLVNNGHIVCFIVIIEVILRNLTIDMP